MIPLDLNDAAAWRVCRGEAETLADEADIHIGKLKERLRGARRDPAVPALHEELSEWKAELLEARTRIRQAETALSFLEAGARLISFEDGTTWYIEAEVGCERQRAYGVGDVQAAPEELERLARMHKANDNTRIRATARCYCELPAELILEDLVDMNIPEAHLANECCWTRICSVRGRHGHVDDAYWQDLCATRGYVLARRNSRGF